MPQRLLKLVLPNNFDPADPGHRSACGKLAGLVGILCNVLLFAGKLLAGMVSGSVSVTADALNNLTDASSSVVTMLGFKLAERPADEHHPYGHARIEYLSGLIVAVLVMFIGAELAKSSIGKILHPEPVRFTGLTIGILLASIAVKLWLSRFCRQLGALIQSAALEATAADSRNDVLSTAAVLVAGLLTRAFGWQIDGFVGLAVALFILYSGIGLVKDTVDPLLGEAPDPDLVRLIRDRILDYDKVLGIHDLMVHDYGPGRRFASVHAEMDSKEDPLVCHDILDNMEREFLTRYNLHLVVHYDPLVTDDAELSHMRELVSTEVQRIDPRLSIHDFRMVRGPEHTNLIFDLAMPFELRGQEAQLKAKIDETVQFEETRYYTVITFDNQSLS